MSVCFGLQTAVSAHLRSTCQPPISPVNAASIVFGPDSLVGGCWDRDPGSDHASRQKMRSTCLNQNQTDKKSLIPCCSRSSQLASGITGQEYTPILTTKPKAHFPHNPAPASKAIWPQATRPQHGMRSRPRVSEIVLWQEGRYKTGRAGRNLHRPSSRTW